MRRSQDLFAILASTFSRKAAGTVASLVTMLDGSQRIMFARASSPLVKVGLAGGREACAVWESEVPRSTFVANT
jgi:hypothetical protein